MFKVRSKYLLLIAAAVWLIAGSQVARMGIEAIAAGNGNLWLLLIGIPATFVVFHMMFSKLVGKHAARIRACRRGLSRALPPPRRVHHLSGDGEGARRIGAFGLRVAACVLDSGASA